ncbi:hypothetical protein [Mesorhizobium sp. LjNodule214]|uniref:hypothetical protein n=1 Tax=Mesorhizobium sp. LjNodule214 TaxID=3342252 RepID=UPI003ECF4000
MRPILLILVAAAAFLVWDQIANDGHVLAGIQHSYNAAIDFASENSIQITFNDFAKR